MRWVIFLLFLIISTSYGHRGSHTRGEVQGTGFTDVNFGNVILPVNGPLQHSQRICVYNSSSRYYRLSIYGLHNTGKRYNMQLISGHNLLPYQVIWSGSACGSKPIEVNRSYILYGASKKPGCKCVPSKYLPKLKIRIPAGWLNGGKLLAGTYQDTLTVLIETYP